MTPMVLRRTVYDGTAAEVLNGIDLLRARRLFGGSDVGRYNKVRPESYQGCRLSGCKVPVGSLVVADELRCFNSVVGRHCASKAGSTPVEGN